MNLASLTEELTETCRNTFLNPMLVQKPNFDNSRMILSLVPRCKNKCLVSTACACTSSGGISLPPCMLAYVPVPQLTIHTRFFIMTVHKCSMSTFSKPAIAYCAHHCRLNQNRDCLHSTFITEKTFLLATNWVWQV